MKTMGAFLHRRILALATMVVALPMLVVGGVNLSAASASTSNSRLHIAYFTDSLDNVYLTTATTAAEKMAKKYGASLTVFSSSWSSNTQLTQIQDAISSGTYQALVVESDDGQANCTPLLNAAKKGMIVAVYNAPICGDGHALYTKGTIGFFGGDDFEYGKLLAKEMVKALNGKGTVAYVSGPVSNSIVQVTTEGLVSGLKAARGIKLVAQLDGQWNAAQGLTETQDLLQAHPNINGIIYGVDQMAVPSVAFLAHDGKIKHIKVVSLGATSNVKALIMKGQMYAGVVQLPAQEAAYAVEAAIQTFDKKKVNVPGWNAKKHVYNLLKDPSLHGSMFIDRHNASAFKPEWSV